MNAFVVKAKFDELTRGEYGVRIETGYIVPSTQDTQDTPKWVWIFEPDYQVFCPWERFSAERWTYAEDIVNLPEGWAEVVLMTSQGEYAEISEEECAERRAAYVERLRQEAAGELVPGPAWEPMRDGDLLYTPGLGR